MVCPQLLHSFSDLCEQVEKSTYVGLCYVQGPDLCLCVLDDVSFVEDAIVPRDRSENDHKRPDKRLQKEVSKSTKHHV